MKAKVTLKYAVTVVVEAEDEEDIVDWMYEHSPEEVYKLADGECILNSCLFELDDEENRIIKIERINVN